MESKGEDVVLEIDEPVEDRDDKGKGKGKVICDDICEFRDSKWFMFLLAASFAMFLGPLAMLFALFWREVRDSKRKRMAWIAGVLTMLCAYIVIAIIVTAVLV